MDEHSKNKNNTLQVFFHVSAFSNIYIDILTYVTFEMHLITTSLFIF